ncbi:MAG: MBL fold metallo-hydrolase [Thermotaleaceae bacterium]
MKLTILGNWGPYPKAGGACSGYLFEEKDIKILLDCGNGTFSRLQQVLPSLNDLTGILLTHLHSDHMSDVMVMRYALGIGRMKGYIDKAVPLYAPGSPNEDFQKLQYENAFELHTIHSDLVLRVGDLKITFMKMNHPIETYGVAIENERKKFVFSGDTRYCSQILKLAEDADLFLCEAGVLERDKGSTTPHLSAQEVGYIGTVCNVKKLLLTHYWPEYDLQEIFQEAKKEYGGELILSEEMKSYEA